MFRVTKSYILPFGLENTLQTQNTLPNPNNSHWTGWNFPSWGLLGSAGNTNIETWPPTTNTGGDSTLPQIQDPRFPNDATKKINDTKPHNNMPPYYSLIYIIKKPLRGGNANAVQQPSPLITN